MFRGAVLCGLVGFAAAACGGAGAAEQLLEPSQPRLEAQEASYEEIEGADTPVSGILDRRRLVIINAETWATFWAELHANISPVPDPPSIDFESDEIIAATMGQRSTGGYTIRIEGISRRGDDLEVVIVETSPGRGCLTTQALTSPATAVSVVRPPGVVEFVEETETQGCS